MMPGDANTQGNVYGGSILRLVDEIAGVVASRHARCNVVTASLDRMDFLSPVYLGNLLILKAAVNYVGHTSMEVGVKIETEDLRSGARTHTGTAYLTFVALGKDGKPKAIPQVIPKTTLEKERFREGKLRRDQRLEDLARRRLKRARRQT
jgi:acyl-CoA hydrolase